MALTMAVRSSQKLNSSKYFNGQLLAGDLHPDSLHLGLCFHVQVFGMFLLTSASLSYG